MEGHLRPALPWGEPSTWIRLLALAGLYYGLAWLGLHFALAGDIASVAWPPAGLAVVSGALWGRRALPALFVGAFAIEVPGVPVPWALAIAGAVCLEAALGGWLIERAGGVRIFSTLGGVPRFGLAAGLAAIPAASIGTLALFMAGVTPADEGIQTWLTWYLGDLVGIVILAPVLLGLAERRWPTPTPAEVAEVATAFVLLGVGAVVAFWLYTAPLVFLVVPPIVWLAMRFGPRLTSVALIALDAAALLGTQAGNGPFSTGPLAIALIVLQVFIVTLSLLSLALAALAIERRRSARDLEQRVVDRTRTLAEVNERLRHEVQERAAAEAAMAEAQQVAQMGTWRWDVSKPHAEWSAELYRIYGLDPATHAPSYLDYLTRVHPDDVERVKAATDEVFKRHIPYSHDERVRRPDGSWRQLHTWAHAVTDADGKLTHLVGACQDITDRVAQEGLLTESLERFRALSDASPIGIAHTTAAGLVDYANKAWIGITGVPDYKDADAVRKAVHSEDQAKMAELWRACVRDGKEFTGEMRFVRPDGSVRLTSSHAVPLRGGDGGLTGFICVVEDITDRRAAERAAQDERESRLEMRRLKEQADFKTNFLRTAAHELGTPLTPIKIQLRILRDQLAKRPPSDEWKSVAILERNVDRLQVLVRDLLESARLQSGRMKLNPRAMDLAHQVHDVVETFQQPAIEIGISLDAKMPNEMAMVGDPDRITQVLYNLLSNAMKFTPPGGRVHVQADDLGETVRFVVEDTGSGFTPEQASRLFQPFSQVHDAMQTSKPGSGLGLYICKGIVEQHGGGITAHSDGPGKGSRFTVSLPRVARPPPMSTAAVEPRLVPGQQGWDR
jgi:PAS domain S-box-containing protein